MAFTQAIITKTGFGNKRVVALAFTADAATSNVETGLSVIEWIGFAPSSMATASAKLYINQKVSGTAAAGFLAISGVASGDRFYVTCYGH